VIESNGWMLHGNCKENKKSYNLTYVYQFDNTIGEQQPTVIPKRSHPDDRTLIKQMSIRLNIDDVGIIIRAEKESDWQKYLESRRRRKNIRNVSAGAGGDNARIRAYVPGAPIPVAERTHDTNKGVELATVNWLVNMLSPSRSDD